MVWEVCQVVVQVASQAPVAQAELVAMMAQLLRRLTKCHILTAMAFTAILQLDTMMHCSMAFFWDRNLRVSHDITRDGLEKHPGCSLM